MTKITKFENASTFETTVIEETNEKPYLRQCCPPVAPVLPPEEQLMSKFLQILNKIIFSGPSPPTLTPSQGRRQKEYPEVNTSQPKYKYQGVSKKT